MKMLAQKRQIFAIRTVGNQTKNLCIDLIILMIRLGIMDARDESLTEWIQADTVYKRGTIIPDVLIPKFHQSDSVNQ